MFAHRMTVRHEGQSHVNDLLSYVPGQKLSSQINWSLIAHLFVQCSDWIIG